MYTDPNWLLIFYVILGLFVMIGLCTGTTDTLVYIYRASVVPVQSPIMTKNLVMTKNQYLSLDSIYIIDISTVLPLMSAPLLQIFFSKLFYKLSG